MELSIPEIQHMCESTVGDVTIDEATSTYISSDKPDMVDDGQVTGITNQNLRD